MKHSEPPPSGLGLTRLVALRMCHDLSGVVGTVGNALDMLDSAGQEAADLASDAATTLRQRLVLWRAILGGQGEAALGTLLGLLEGQVGGGRAVVDAAALDSSAMVAPEVVPVLLAAVLLAGEALPRGGTVRLAGDPAREMAVLPQGARAAWPAAMVRALAGGAQPEDPGGRDVMSLLLVASAAMAGVRIDLALPSGDVAGPLLLTMPS